MNTMDGTCTEISKLSAAHRCRLRSVLSKGFARMKRVGLSEGHPSSNLVSWNSRIAKKEHYQITEFASFESFQQQQQRKRVSHVTQLENKIKLLTFYTIPNKKLGHPHQYWKGDNSYCIWETYFPEKE